MIRDIYNLLRSGLVQRWHSNPDLAHCGETNAQHQWSAALIALRIEPALSREALIYALTHDAGEMGAGDLSYDFKRANRDIADAHCEFEMKCRDELINTDKRAITVRDSVVVKCADWLSAYATMIRHEPWLRFREDWRRQLADTRCLLGSLSSDHRYWHAIAGWVKDLHTEAEKRDGRAM